MRRLIGYFRSYCLAIGPVGYVLSVLGLTAVLVYARYGLHRLPVAWFWLFALPYWAAFGLQYAFFRGLSFPRSFLWWAVLLGAPSLFALQSAFAPPFTSEDYY